jgi:N-acetylmuramidase
LFSRATGGKYDATAPDVSNPVPGGYGPGGDNQYTRLAQAYALDAEAALGSASWGLGQILGSHAPNVGYDSVDDMVAAMAASEDQQLQAVVGFIQWQNLEKALQQQDWVSYARAYNGADYAKNQYDTRLNSAYITFKDPTRRPDLTVRSAQMLLYLLGYNPQGVDGSLGMHTLTALHNFQAAQGQTLTTGIDDGVMASLQGALPAAVNLSFV